jgi:hypothetical protein
VHPKVKTSHHIHAGQDSGGWFLPYTISLFQAKVYGLYWGERTKKLLLNE